MSFYPGFKTESDVMGYPKPWVSVAPREWLHPGSN